MAISKNQASSSDQLVKQLNIKVCGCCLGTSSSDANEIVECDGCGISVHEGCYGICESGSVASTISSASTEPWFCEPCRAGVMSPPSCELCPVIGGVYKETEVGRWVHLVCALYIPGVAFGDTDKMCHVTIFEMNYSMWGRKPCMLCSTQDDGNQTNGLTGGVRLARTGVCIQCDAGLCRSVFHVSCAHAAGLLSEPSYDHVQGHVDDTYLAHCRLHSDRQVVRKRRRSFLIHHINSRKRREDIRAKWAQTKPLSPSRRTSSRALPNETPDERILRKLYRRQAGFVRDKANSHEPWLPTQKLPRLLTTSASAIRKIQRLGELQGVDIERQNRHEIQLQALAEAKKKWHVPPAFSIEFMAYYEDRERRLDDLKAQLTDDVKLNDDLTTNDKAVRQKYDEVSKINEQSLAKNNSLRATIEAYRAVLGLGGKLPPESAIPALKPLVKSFEIVTPNVKARATVYSQTKFKSDGKIATNSCGICKKLHDQHLLAHCDTCKLHYHLSCLTPPLTRMPKKSKLYGWSCSECYPDSTSEEEVDDDDDATRKRNRSRRLAASKALVSVTDYEANWSNWQAYEAPPQPTAPPTASTSGQPKKKRGRKPKKRPPETNGTEEVLQPMPMAPKSPTDEIYTTNGSGGDEKARQSLIDKAAAKAERKEAKRAERARRKLEKKQRKKLLKEQQQTQAPTSTLVTSNRDSDDVEIIEDAAGQCTVRIKPKPIKLKINLPKATSEDLPQGNGHVSPGESPAAKRPRLDSTASVVGVGRPPAIRKDTRTHCDKCGTEGTNANLVRCDECKKCFHFTCLIPPVKKSPKVAGYSWHCSECDPSDVDSDWHLD